MENTASVQYVSLANKYRPQTFADMVGQESISKTLQNALRLGRIGHAYLFYGPRGCGKTTTARILAKALNCTGHGTTGPTAEPCGKCAQCMEISQSADLDVLELDAASNTQVEKVREVILDTVALAAGRDRFKVFILDEVHMLSSSSFNALLKTIEEPPAHVVFILATTEKNKVPATIVSRCQTFRFRPLTVEEISAHLLELAQAEGIDLAAGAAKIIAKNAGGAMRDGLTLLDRAIAYCGNHINEQAVSDMLGLTSQELLKEAASALCHKDGAAMHQVFQTLQAEGFDAHTFLKDLKNVLGDLFYFSLGQGTEPFTGAKDLTQTLSSGFLARLTRKLNKLIEEVKFSDDALVSAEVGLFTIMDSVLDIDNFIRRLEALETGAGVPPTKPSSRKESVSKPGSKVTKNSRPEASPSVEKNTQQEQPTLGIQSTLVEPKMEEMLSNRQVWDKMLAHFSSSPFVYDVMLNCSVQFTSPSQWVLVFAEGKEFYQIPAQHKLAELATAASQFSGRPITISLQETALKTPSSKTDKPARSTQQQTKSTFISEEEPFMAGPFSTEQGDIPQDAPEEVKEILKLFPGEIVA